jgi:hypothetical protein
MLTKLFERPLQLNVEETACALIAFYYASSTKLHSVARTLSVLLAVAFRIRYLR